MKERFTTFKLFLIQHFFVVGLVLLFVVLSLCSCGRASADSVGSDTASYYDYIHSIVDTWPVSNRESFNTAIDSKITSDYYFVTNGSNFILFCKKPSFGLISQYNRGHFSPRSVGFNIDLYPNWQDSFPFYMFQSFNGGSVMSEIYDFQGGTNISPMRFAWTGNYYSYQTDFGQSGSNVFDYNGTWYGNVDSFYEIFGSNGTGYSYGWSVYPLLVESPRPQYVEDDRLKFSVYSLPAGGYYLQTDIRDFFPFQPGSHATIDLVPKSISLSFDFDGTEESFVISPGNSTFSDLYIISTPFHVFGDLAEYENVSIKKCEFTIQGSAQGLDPVDETFKIACDYYLKKAVEPVEIADVEYNDDTETLKLTTAEIDSKNDVVNMQNYYYSQTGGGGQDLDIPEGFTVKLITVYSSGTLADALNNLDNWGLFAHPINTLVNLGIVAITDITSISNTNDFNDFMEHDIHDNAYGAYYDIVCYYWVPAASSGEVDAFYYYITSSGKLRTVNQTLADIWQESNQTAFNTYAIYDYLYSRLNDFESQSLEYSFQLIGLSEKQNNILNTIDLDLQFGFDSVVDAINNIVIPQPVVFDDSDILDKIDDLIDLVQGLIDGNEVDTPQECIQYFYDNQNGTVDLAFLPAYYEGMTLDFLYSIQGESQNNLRSGAKSGGGPAVLVNNSLLIQIFNQFKDSFTDNFIPQNIRVFLSNITNDTGNHMYYFQLFHNDYDPEDFDGLAD